ncbi:Olfactory receptor 1044 [Myotis davidii]|uniref:Olfactory receptor 1044 n=1 Tax=Myotis davidii TaxID=225400 RepID=L5LJ42_MYODS|nr:Olfactory receptor 1044 [Myotis davidii]
MAAENCTVFTDFILLGLSGRQDVQRGLFVLFLLVYGITVIANLGMILLINMDPRLHTPMYYFLSNLSFCDVCYSSTVAPKMLADFLSEQKRIPYNLCFLQMFLLLLSCGCVVGSSIITVLLSYSYIITTILRMNSAEGRHKAFSTCASHLTAVGIFFGTLFLVYFQPSLSNTMDVNKVASVFYTVVIPMLNPLIYSLRNKDVKGVLRKAVGRKLCLG